MATPFVAGHRLRPAESATVSTAVVPFWRDARLRWLLAVALVMRLAFLYAFTDVPLVHDEIEYQEIAVNIVEGRGFAMDGRLTSWRPPLYPFFLAGLYSVTSAVDPNIARAAQALLSLVTIGVVYALGRTLLGPATGVGAAVIFALYPSFLFFNNHLLTEVLFTFLLTVALYCFARYVHQPGLPAAIGCGVSWGLAALTREVVLPMVVPLAILVAYRAYPRWPRMAVHAAALTAAALIVITPWAVRNTRLQGTLTVIATNGGSVFLSGNNEYTPADRPWQQHEFPRELRWRHMVPAGGLTEGQRQQLAYQKGLEYIRQHPGQMLERAVVKAANVWGLERDIVGTFLNGGYGAAARLGAVPAAAAIFGGYAATLLAGIAGLSFAVGRRTPGGIFHLLFILLTLFMTVAHALAFGHPRFHLPLISVIAVYAAYAWTIRADLWRSRRSRPFVVSCLLAALALAIWVREVVFVEFERFMRGVLGT